MSPAESRILVTGLGLATPLGWDRETSWRRYLAGERALDWLPEAEFGPGWAGGRLPPWDGEPSPADPTTLLALATSAEAIRDAGLSAEDIQDLRTGCVIGTSKGGMRSAARWGSLVREGRAARAAARDAEGAEGPADWRGMFPHEAGAAVARTWGLRGPLLSPVAACATGLLSLARGAQLIRDGMCDRVLAGSADASLTPAVLASFRRLGVLARVKDDPAAACRPFDRGRSGFLVGEGGAVLVLERESSAAERGAAAYAEWVDCRSAADTTGLTQVDAGAESLTWSLRELLAQTGTEPSEIDYLNLHGTGTVSNDRVEARAIAAACGPFAEDLPCSSLKGRLGHLLGAAGSVEVAMTLLAMRDGVLPPTANLREIDPECRLNVLRAVQRRSIRRAVKISLGFGGPVAAALLRAVEPGRNGVSRREAVAT